MMEKSLIFVALVIARAKPVYRELNSGYN